jgi:hypothetical protein
MGAAVAARRLSKQSYIVERFSENHFLSVANRRRSQWPAKVATIAIDGFL